MCLITRSQTPNIAKEDIKVYKIMHVAKPSDAADDIYGVPPYYGYSILPHHGYHYHKGLNKPEEESEPPKMTHYDYDVWYFVEEGYLHAFVDWFSACKALTYLKEDPAWPIDHFDIVEMYIPAGATYYVGNEYDIAASALYWPVEDKNA